MRDSIKYILFVLASCLCLIDCAKRGAITGGPKDEKPPQLLRASPPNKSTNFKAKEIRLLFDELVTIDNPQEQILISPPMKNPIEVKPSGFATKTLKIKIIDTLIPNTTYSISFGNSIVDYNEKNAFEFFQYVFSTGNQLDSLNFKGSVKDAFNKEIAKNTSVFLYENNETFTDSTIFNELPRYVASTIDSSTFKFSFLKEGSYKIIALKDKNGNYKFDPKTEKIGFLEKNIEIPKDSTALLSIFQEEPEFKFARAKQLSKHKFQIGYFGEISEPKIEILGDFPDTLKFTTKLLESPSKADTLLYWVKPYFKQDSIVFKATSGTVIDTLVSRYKDQYKDSLKLTIKERTLKLKSPAIFTANTPLDSLDTEKITLFDKDTLPVKFDYKIDKQKNQIEFQFPKKEKETYSIQILPEAVSDFIDNKNKDTLNFLINTLENNAYGTLGISINKKGIKKPIIVQLIANKQVVEEKVLPQKTYVNFKGLLPNNYIIKIIVDENENGKWDSGNYLKKVKPEPVFFHEEPINVRANWDVNQQVIISD